MITEKGQLYTFGDGRHGKLALGQDSFSNQFIPFKAKRFSKFTVEKVRAAFYILMSDEHFIDLENTFIASKFILIVLF